MGLVVACSVDPFCKQMLNISSFFAYGSIAVGLKDQIVTQGRFSRYCCYCNLRFPGLHLYHFTLSPLSLEQALYILVTGCLNDMVSGQLKGELELDVSWHQNVTRLNNIKQRNKRYKSLLTQGYFGAFRFE